MQKIYQQLIDQAVVDGVITPKQYLQIPWHERESMQYLFSADGRQTVANGIITLQQYLQIRCEERFSMQYIFSADGRQLVADGIMTLEQYLQIPLNQRQNVMIASQETNTRQRIINGEITIENVIEILHMFSVDQFVSKSATRLANPYKLRVDSTGLESTSKEKSIYPQINRQLNKLENKAKNLRARDHILAYCKAIHIVQLLRGLNHDYFIEKKIDYKTYKKKSLEIINQERPELDKHRGYKQILANLLILILTLGTAQLINKACTGNFLFFKKADSSKHIDTLSNMVEKMEVALII